MSEWFPMHTARVVRNGRPVELKLVLHSIGGYGFDNARFNDESSERMSYFVIGHYSREERGWYVADRGSRDITCGKGPYIDDDFDGWRNIAPIYPEGYDPSNVRDGEDDAQR